jgi:hypothetical protein
MSLWWPPELVKGVFSGANGKTELYEGKHGDTTSEGTEVEDEVMGY